MAKKCVVCGQYITEEEIDSCVPYKNNRLVHSQCFNQTMKMIKADKDEQLEKQKKKKESASRVQGRKKAEIKTPKAELKDGLSDEEYKAKRGFYDVLKAIMGVDKLTPKIYAVSDKYITQYNMTWDGMKDTLVYLRDIKEKELTGDIVGIIPYYYEESQNFYEDIKKVEENNKNVNINKLYSERVIQITPPKRIIKQLSFDD